MGERDKEVKYTKSYFDVLGVCCAAEASLVEKILLPLEGIQKVSVIVPSKTVIVVHDSLGITQLDIANALNKARLEATIRVYGNDKIIKKWPSPYIVACGTLLIVSMFKQFCDPLKYLAIAAVAVGLPPIIMRSIAAIRRFTLDINILLLIAVGGAIAMKDYTEAAFTVFLFTIAEWLETLASLKATAGMSSLMSLAPQKAVLAETGQVVDVQDVKINTILAVKAGEVVPIDGIVVEGHSEVDEKSLTGESFPVTKQPESLVWAGTMNLDGYISVKTTALAENSAVAKMTRLVEEAQNRRSKTQKLIESCAKYYTPAVVVVAAGVALVPLIRRQNNEEKKKKFNLALVLLVSACPCALVLSTPVATFCALVKAARTGLLIKGGDVLEALATTKVAAFDKTGTITKGEFSVVEFQSLSSEVDLRTLLYWVSSVESKSSHPMAAALVDYANSKSIKAKAEDVTNFHIYPGEGIHGQIGGRNIYIGNKRIAARASCETVSVLNMGERKGVTMGYIFSENVLVGTFALSDTCRVGAAKALKDLKSLDIKTAMLTGDTTEAAMHAQNQIGHVIEEIHAELLPEDKVRLIEDLKSIYGSVVMVGDGLNDAPALASANVGISMGISGSAVAMETSHVTLMSNDICKIPKIIKLARKTYWKIVQNIFFSVITKLAIVVLAFANHPILWAAVLADVGTCILVILNSMMLLKTKTIKEKKCCDSHHKTSNESRKHHHNGTKSLCQSTSNCSHEEKHCHGHDTADSRNHSQCNVHENSSQDIHCGQSKSSCGLKEDKHCHGHDTEDIRKHSKCNVQESLCRSASNCDNKEDKHCHGHDTADSRKHSKCNVQENSSNHIYCGQSKSSCGHQEYKHCHGHDIEGIRKRSKSNSQENSSNHVHCGTSNCSQKKDESCHSHDERKHGKCNGQENSSNHIQCCQGSATSRETTEKDLASANKSSSLSGYKNENHTCCQKSEEHDDCKNKVSFSSSDIYIDIENQRNGECCTVKNECCSQKHLSSSTDLRTREITGNCCRNCAEGFSVGSVAQLQEIISE